MDRRTFVGSGAGGLLALSFPANGQPQGKIARVGFLVSSPREALKIVGPTIVDRLRELGYVEGRNVIFHFRNAELEERFRELATELVRVGVQVIFAVGPYALRAARAITATVPIVGLDNESDPVAAGYAANLARPGGNVTGVFLDQSEVSAKQLQLLKEAVPGLTRVAVLWDAAIATAQRDAVDDAARQLGITVSSIAWRDPDALPGALRTAMQDFVLVDFENVQPKDLGMLTDGPFKVKVFLGPNQSKVPVAVAAALQSLGSSAEYVLLETAGNNALDFHIAYYIGALSAEDPSAFFHIISKDSGFDPLIKYLKGKKVLAQRSTAIADIPYFKPALPVTPEAQIEVVVADLIRRKASRPRTQKTLLSTLHALFKKELSEQQLSQLFAALCNRGVVKVDGTKVSYELPVDA